MGRLLSISILIYLSISSCYRPASRQSFEDIKLIEGSWSTTEGAKFNESWTLMNDRVLKGIGFNIKNGDTLFSEQLKIFLENDHVYYAAKPGKKKDFVRFRMEKADRNKWKFVNPENDYPNIIEYELFGDSVLMARISNIRGNKEIEFKMKRTKP